MADRGGGMGQGNAAPQAAAGGNGQNAGIAETNFFMRPEHRRVLRRIFKTPYDTPTSDIGLVADGGQGAPPIRQIYTFNVPRSAFSANPSSFRDLIMNNLGNAPNRHLRDTLLFFSAIVSDDAMGTTAGQDVDPNAQFLDPNGDGLFGNNDNNNNNNGGAGRGRGRPNGALNLGGRVDRRGEIVNDGRGLMFNWGANAFPKVIPCVEELRSPARHPVAYRFWFFVFDPVFDINKGFIAQLQRNTELYQAGNLPENIYLSHAMLQSTNDFVERLVIPYLQQGSDNDYVPMGLRAKINDRVNLLLNNERMRALNVPLSDEHHPARPSVIFSKMMGFSLYLEDVCQEQRDPSNYFSIVQLANNPSRDDANDEDGLADQNANDANDPDLVVDNDVVEYMDGISHSEEEGGDENRRNNNNNNDNDGSQEEQVRKRLGLPPDPRQKKKKKVESGAPVMRPRDEPVIYDDDNLGDNLPTFDDDDVTALMQRVNIQLAGGSDNTAQQGDGNDEAHEDFDGLNEDPTEISRIGNNVLSLRATGDDKFRRFLSPDLVCRISSNQFGRMLLNTPLLERIRAISNSGGPDTGSHFEEMELFDSEDGNEREHDDTFFSDPHVTPGVLRERRKAAIRDALKSLGRDHQIVVSDRDYSDLSEFKSKLTEIRISVSLRKQVARDNAAQKEVMEMLRHASGITFQNAVAGEDDVGIAYGGFLPETLSQRLSQAEFQTFASKHVFLHLRFNNLRAKARIVNTHKEGPELEAALMAFRLRATAEFWNIFLTSMKLSPSLIEVRNWWKRQAPMEQWGEHLDLMQNLTSFGNLMLTILSRYNGIFRGSTNQQAFMLTTFCHYGTFEYDWGIKTNLLLMGKGAAGKSYVFETVEILTCPGTMSSWSHTTDKAYSTGTSFSDQTFCMHEAPLSYIGVDKYGKSTLADPVLKDRLAKQRSGTRYFTKDEQGNRITKDEQVMIMGNIIMATNEGIPPEDSPLMQRFIIMAVNDMKRPDFNLGDNSQPLKDLVSSTDNKRHIQFAHLLSFYVLILCKMIMCGIIDEPSTDASEILVKDILATFTKRTKVSTSHPRKRKMIMDITRILCYVYSVHMAIFSLFGEEHCRDHEAEVDIRGGDPEAPRPKRNRGIYKPFTPEILVKAAMPRMYVTDEQVVYAITLLSFMFESEHRYVILDTIVSNLNPGVHSGEPFELQTARFRVMANPSIIAANGYSASRRSRQQQNYYQKGQGRFNDTPAAPAADNASNGSADGQVDEEEESPFVIDARYAIDTADNFMTIYNNVVHNIPQNTPSVVEVVRTLKDMSNIMFDAHPAQLVPATPMSGSSDKRKRASGGLTEMSENARDGFEEEEEVDAMDIDETDYAESIARIDAEYNASAAAKNKRVSKDVQRTMASASAFVWTGGISTRDSRQSLRNSDDTMPSNQMPADADNDADETGEAHSEARRDERAKRAASSSSGLMTVAMKNKHRHQMYQWVLDEDAPTKSEPVVICCRDPTDQRGGRVMVGVLIEYIKRAPRGDALLESIKSVLSTNIMPREGRTYLTGMPYVHQPTPESKPEIMPQFCRTLTVPYSERPYVHQWVRIGTRDSQSFLRSTVRFGTADDHAASLANHLATSMGLRMEPHKDFNEYCVKRHFQRIGYTLEETENHMAPVMYMPAVESAHLRSLTDRIARNPKSNLELTAVYPDDCVEELLTIRQTDQFFVHEEDPTLYEESGSLVSTIHQIGTGEDKLADAAATQSQSVSTIPLQDAESIYKEMLKARRNYSKNNTILQSHLGDKQAERKRVREERKQRLFDFAKNKATVSASSSGVTKTKKPTGVPDANRGAAPRARTNTNDRDVIMEDAELYEKDAEKQADSGGRFDMGGPLLGAPSGLGLFSSRSSKNGASNKDSRKGEGKKPPRPANDQTLKRKADYGDGKARVSKKMRYNALQPENVFD